MGKSIRVRFVPDFDLYHAACDLRRRRIVLNRGLIDTPHEFRRILIHELFHFAWVRLGNPARKSFAAMINREWERNARGELGWSAERLKLELRKEPADPASRRFRDYVVESFCDTAAWHFSGLGRHPEFTLGARHRARRARWFSEYFAGRKLSI